MEKWIKGFEGIYAVTDDADIISYRSGSPTRLNPSEGGCGCLQFTLWDGVKKHTATVHRVVAEAFIPHDEHHTVVKFIDGDKMNPVASNLKWVKPSKKPVIQCDLNGRVIAIFESVASAEEITGVSNTSIRACYKGRSKTGGGYIWKLVDEAESD
jgi:hypothetical protein